MTDNNAMAAPMLSKIQARNKENMNTFELFGAYRFIGKSCVHCGEVPVKESCFGINFDFFIDQPVKNFIEGLRELADNLESGCKRMTGNDE